MKALIALTLALFASFSFAGSVSSGSFSTKTTAYTHTEIQGETSSAVYGEGETNLIDGLNYRNEEYTRDEYTVTEFDGESNTTRVTKTQGSNKGLIGHSVSNTKSTTEGYTDSVTYVDNAITGDYETFSIGQGGINYEEGYFEDLEQVTKYEYQDYETKYNSESSTAYTAW